jgi:hypothetical protein
MTTRLAKQVKNGEPSVIEQRGRIIILLPGYKAPITLTYRNACLLRSRLHARLRKK